jgi:arginine deiminase
MTTKIKELSIEMCLVAFIIVVSVATTHTITRIFFDNEYTIEMAQRDHLQFTIQIDNLNKEIQYLKSQIEKK